MAAVPPSHREFFVQLSKGRLVRVYLGPSLELLDLRLQGTEGGRPVAVDVVGFALSSSGRELRKALERLGRSCGSCGEVAEKLRKLTGHWRRSHRCAAVLVATMATRPAPRLFVEDVGSNTAELSWELLEDSNEGFFEVALFGYDRSNRPRDGDTSLAKLGNFRVEGGPGARRFRLQRLEELRWYRARLRMLAPQRRWMSEWSNEVSFRTLSCGAAKAAGRLVGSNNFLVKSERLLRLCVDDSHLEENATEIERLKVQFVRDLFGTAGSQTSEVATNNLLDARYCQRGWPDFVQHGARYSRPPQQREERLRRMRLAIAAEELYGSEYPLQNAWCQGPFYYEETGMKNMAKYFDNA
mmetsp:Transcript_28895/g.46663  ORF Transcript_28895/g.46663 Transcript_28895/m.46663 type:complete len:355 (-) Transcript_28895:84-1148(-)